MDEEDLDYLYTWVDSFKLSRAKRNIARDFSDGLLVGEITNQRYPGMVELHNIVQSLNVNTKKTNWDTLNRKVFSKMGFTFSKEDINSAVSCKPMAVEKMLKILRVKQDVYQEHRARGMQNIYNNLVSKTPEPPKDIHSPQVNSRNLPSVKPDNYGRNMNPNRISHVKSAGIQSVNRNLVGRSEPALHNYPAKSGGNAYGNNSPLQPKKGANGKAGAGGDYGSNGVQFYEDKKEDYIRDLKDTIGILEQKVTKLEQLVSLKEHKIVLLEGSMKELMGR